MRFTHIGYGLFLVAAIGMTACDGRSPSGPSALPTAAAASAYELSGDVTGAGGAGLGGVEITLSRADGSERRAVTDADGNFRIGGLDAGDWEVSLSCKGYADRGLDIVVNGNARISFQLLPVLQ